MDHLTTRRGLFVAGGVGLLATAGFASTARAKDVQLTDTEKANLELVKAFMASWSAKPLDIDAIMAKYFDPNAVVRWSQKRPAVTGLAAAANDIRPAMPAGADAEIHILDILAKGPLVATSRLDVVKVPGQPDHLFDVGGVHIIKNGKIVEYNDYASRR